MTQNEALELILSGLSPALKQAGFKPQKDSEEAALFAGNAGALRIVFDDDRVALEHSEDDDDFARLSLALLELDKATERDCKYIADDLADEITGRFCAKKNVIAKTAGKKPAPKSISKTAIKNGDAYYDLLTFGNAFTTVYPELRAEYKANYETYGEFLAEDFFHRVGNAAVVATIRQNDKPQLKKLFNLLNDVYENGINDVQSLVIVTILGSLENDTVLLARCVDYMSDDLRPVAIEVNKFLASGTGKGAKKRLDHPPIYKPKKEKRPGMFQRMMAAGAQQQQGPGGFGR